MPLWHDLRQISIHALREESDGHRIADLWIVVISIHALREESDLTFDHYYPVTIPISIHALREESDTLKFDVVTACVLFQSTLSVRRATAITFTQWIDQTKFQSTLSVRRATHGHGVKPRGLSISIHALREESDHIPALSMCHGTNFNPRSP